MCLLVLIWKELIMGKYSGALGLFYKQACLTASLCVMVCDYIMKDEPKG